MLRPGKRLSWGHLLASAGLFLAFMPAPAAAAVQGIGLSPTSQELSLVPGENYSGELTVINDGDRDVVYKVFAADYRVKDEGYTGDFSSAAAAADVSPVSWVKLPAGTLTVKSRQQVKLPYSIRVPLTASVGGHYGAIFIETVPPPAAAGALIARVERIGSLLYIAVKGDLRQSGDVTNLTVPVVQASSPVRAALRLHNDGNVHFLTEGTAQLENLFGKVGKTVPFKGEILPGTTRRFELALPATSPIGIYKVTTTAKFLDRTVISSGWMLLMPRVTFIVLSATLLLILILTVLDLVRRAKRRHKH